MLDLESLAEVETVLGAHLTPLGRALLRDMQARAMGTPLADREAQAETILGCPVSLAQREAEVIRANARPDLPIRCVPISAAAREAARIPDVSADLETA